ncbi:alpha/beta hydrolase fold protein [Calothrix sp. NIES-4071]|nr:alpha/beta hydrolase fold protein [Calothrix sp. NIES-4071]BAZ54734.1 alpha/beta hydrolase fold protein [Calothrix sp. NIES-4105]
MPKIHVNEIDLFYNIQGKGTPLLLIAGFDCDSSYWSLVVPALVDNYQVIRLDNRGVGKSSAPNTPYSIKQMADDTTALLDYLGITEVHVAGHSMGGQIAQELAISNPGKVKSLILLSSWAKGNAKFDSIIEMFGNLSNHLEAKIYQKTLLPWMYTENFYSNGSIKDIISIIEYYPLPAPHTLYHQSRAILDNDTSDRLTNILCPTLVVVGKEDILTPVAFSQELADGIDDAKLVVIERSGHSCLVESPDVVAEVMLKFLASYLLDINVLG